ncbi:MAG: hypothetical protein ACRCZF_08725, partial [Gemmataceae bacterium]
MAMDAGGLYADLALRGWFPTGLAVLMGLAALAAVVLVYRREAGRIPVVPRIVMAGLRALALISILFLLLRPTLVFDSRGDRPRPIALLVDDSQSMQTRDSRTNPLDRWRAGVAFGMIPPDKVPPAVPTSTDLP